MPWHAFAKDPTLTNLSGCGCLYSPACARLCSGKLACTLSLRNDASLSVLSLHFLAGIVQERTTLPSTTSDRRRPEFKRKNVCKSHGANLTAQILSRAFSRKIPVRGRFFFFRTAVFNHFPLEDFLKPTRVDQSVPQEPISVRNSRSANSPYFSFNLLNPWDVLLRHGD